MANTVEVVGGLGSATDSDVLEGVTYTSDNGIKRSGTFSPAAANISYDNVDSGLLGTNVQAAIDEISNLVGNTSVADQIIEAITQHDHANDNIQLYDTISKYETVEVNASVSDSTLNIVLSSETYTDFSGVTLVLTSGDDVQSAVASAEGIVVGLLSKPSFTLSLETDYDTSDILITCTYQLDLNKVLHDYILHVDLDGDSGGSGELCTGSVVYRTKSDNLGMLAIPDASPIEHDVTVVISSDTYDDVSGITVSFVTEISAEGNVVHQSAVTDENGTVTLRSVSEPWAIVLEKDGNQIGFFDSDFVITCTYQIDLQTVLDDIENNIQDLETSKASKDYVTEKIQDAIVQEVYVQDEAPTDAVEGSIWVDTNNDGLANSANPKFHIVDVTGTNVNNIDFSQYAIGDIILAFSL